MLSYPIAKVLTYDNSRLHMAKKTLTMSTLEFQTFASTKLSEPV